MIDAVTNGAISNNESGVKYIPGVISFVTANDLCIGCGLCSSLCPENALEMDWDESGFLVPVLSGICVNDQSCLTVCPFNPEPKGKIQNENDLANIFLKDTTQFNQRIGKYIGISTGFSHDFRSTSSSGGIATYILSELLEKGVVSHVFSVRECHLPGIHYEYSRSSNKEDLLATSKTKYFPVTLATVFADIGILDGKVAIVGVACFIKSIRLAQVKNLSLKEKIPFLVGIICGGVKSRFFTEYLSEKAGVPKGFCMSPLFRIKDENNRASDYSFGCTDATNHQARTLPMRKLGDMWGTGLFKANACDFCDDISTELADISLGDAWLAPFSEDARGTNIIITRSLLAEKLIATGIEQKRIQSIELPLSHLLDSFKSSINHRQTGLLFRIIQAKKHGHLVPEKRLYNETKLTFEFELIQYLRLKIRKMSISVWKRSRNAGLFDHQMSLPLFILKASTKAYHFCEVVRSGSILQKILKRIR